VTLTSPTPQFRPHNAMPMCGKNLMEDFNKLETSPRNPCSTDQSLVYSPASDRLKTAVEENINRDFSRTVRRETGSHPDVSMNLNTVSSSYQTQSLLSSNQGHGKLLGETQTPIIKYSFPDAWSGFVGNGLERGSVIKGGAVCSSSGDGSNPQTVTSTIRTNNLLCSEGFGKNLGEQVHLQAGPIPVMKQQTPDAWSTNW
jgi:hypothetical protein